ncbi:hypothetical protein AAFF_G00140790 [Aldrovandia affinis]|uniref:Uncharacterized protein n=1 Tax=Aldrovandia affinis TaxID=143900 RepID=A0AAD7TCE0_9TELE|nr:hypothetical protein AAFF_G00140790 [Aldrovandia affinis]
MNAAQSVRKGISCPSQDPNCTRIVETLSAWNDSAVSAYKLVELPPVATSVRKAQGRRFRVTTGEETFQQQV